MKAKILILMLATLIFGGSHAFCNSGLTIAVEITKTNTSASVPVALAANQTWFKRATVIGKRTARVNNTGTIYLGQSSTNDTQPIELTPGSELVIEAPEGEWLDLRDWYLDVATVNDGVMIIYTW